MMWLLAAGAVMAGGCGRGDGGAESNGERRQGGRAGSSGDGPEIATLTVDALAAPRHDEPLIAGERARVGLRIRGGAPPYQGRVGSIRVAALGARREDRSAGQDDAGRGDAGDVVPIDAAFAPDPNRTGSGDVDMAMEAVLDSRTRSGRYRLRAELRDAEGRTATAESVTFAVVGADAPLAPAGRGTPRLEMRDVAGRQRAAFVRGEQIAITAVLDAAGEAAADAAAGTTGATGATGANRPRAVFTVRDPRGPVVARVERPVASGRSVLPIIIPQLARPGLYPVAVAVVDAHDHRGDSDDRGRDDHATPRAVEGALQIQGAPFPPTSRLILDHLDLYGGADGRAPRAGILRRGETLRVEARTGGGRRDVTVTLRLRDRTGAAVTEAEIGRSRVALPAPDSRTFVTGSWTVPADIRPGRYQLHVEATEGDAVAARYRDILVR